MTDLPTLIAQLEAAPEGSRELDAEIFCLLNKYILERYTFGSKAICRVDGVGHPVVVFESEIPHYTTSLDAAMTLIPDGWQKHGLLCWPGYEHGKLINRARVTLHHMLSSGGGPKVDAYGATRELALCAAALRARGET